MRVAILVEDRDSGYVFLDPSQAPILATPMSLTLGDGVIFGDIEDDNKVVWLMNDRAGTIRVVDRDTVDFSDAFDVEYPVPSMTVCLDSNDYEALLRLSR